MLENEEDVKYCSVCGVELKDDEKDDGICDNCKASIVLNPDVYPNIQDFII